MGVTVWVLALLAFSQGSEVSVPDRLYAAGRFEQAAAAYRQLLRQSPDNPELLVRLGACEYSLGRFGDAAQSFRAALAASPDDPRALIGLGTSLVTLHRPKAAIAPLRAALKQNPNDTMALRALGHAYQEANEFFEGERLLSGLVRADPRDAESWFYLGALLYDNNYYHRALESLDRSLALRPANLRARIYRAGALGQLGRDGEAETAFRRLLARPEAAGDPELLLGYAQFLFRRGQAEAALAPLDRALQGAPHSAKVHFWKARALLQTGRATDALQDAEAAVHDAPDMPNAHNLLLRIYRTQGRMDEAAREAAWLEAYERKKARGK